MRMFCDHLGIDPPPDIKVSGDSHEPGVDRTSEVGKDLVGHGLMEGALITEGPEVVF